MKTQQLSGASSDNRARTKWWIFPSAEKAGGGVQSRRMAMGWSALCPLVPPLHHQPLLFVLILTSWSTPPAHLLCQLRHNPLDLYCTVSALDLCGTRSKSRSLQMGEFRAARLAGALFELVQLELCKLSWAGNLEAIFSWVGSASSGRHWTDLKRPWQVNQVRMVNQQEVYVQGCFRNSIKSKITFSHRGKDPKEFPINRETQNFSISCPIAMDRPSWHRPFIRLTECSMGQCHTQTQTTQITCFQCKNFPQSEF